MTPAAPVAFRSSTETVAMPGAAASGTASTVTGSPPMAVAAFPAFGLATATDFDPGDGQWTARSAPALASSWPLRSAASDAPLRALAAPARVMAWTLLDRCSGTPGRPGPSAACATGDSPTGTVRTAASATSRSARLLPGLPGSGTGRLLKPYHVLQPLPMSWNPHHVVYERRPERRCLRGPLVLREGPAPAITPGPPTRAAMPISPGTQGRGTPRSRTAGSASRKGTQVSG